MSHQHKQSNQTMKRILVSVFLLTVLGSLSAQERLSTEEALRYARLAGADAQQLAGTPIATRVDLAQPVALHDGDYGGMVLPQAGLTAESLAQAGDQVLPVGQLWLLRLTVMKDGEGVPADKLRVATVKTRDGNEVKVPQCALGVQRSKAGALELLIFGKDKTPILTAPLKPIETKQEMPLDMDAVRESESAQITLKILGRYEARFRVTELEL